MKSKIKFKKLLIFVLAALIAVMVATLITGQSEKVEIVVIKKEGLNPEKTIGEQLDFFEERTILKKDLNQLGNSILSLEEFQSGEYNKKAVVHNLGINSPVPKSLLVEIKEGSSFANSMMKYHKLYKMPSGRGLPKDLVAGDRIDVILLREENGVRTTRLFFDDLPVHSVEGGSFNILVSQRDELRLMFAENLGTFIYQLAGRREVSECTAEQLKDRRTEQIECYVNEDADVELTDKEVMEDVLGEGFDQKGNSGNVGEGGFDFNFGSGDEGESGN